MSRFVKNSDSEIVIVCMHTLCLCGSKFLKKTVVDLIFIMSVYVSYQYCILPAEIEATPIDLVERNVRVLSKNYF